MGPGREQSHQMLEALGEPGAYPHDPSAPLGVETIQTHISHLYLTRDRVYKLRKAIVLPFLSFGTPENRNADCLREIALNRRLAPDVYLGVAALRQDADGIWQVGPATEVLDTSGTDAAPCEHAVVMKRLPESSNALHMLAKDQLGPEHVDAVAEMLARFHATVGLGTPAPFDPDRWLARHEEVLADTFRIARESGCAELALGRLAECEKRMSRLFDAGRNDFERRRVMGRVVDGHGDLHLDHVYFLPGAGEPIAIDCIEFNDDLRQVDVAAELAFFAMDLAYRERADLGERFLRRYAALRDDFDLYSVVDWHIQHRAMVRAAVAGIAAMEPEIELVKRRAAAASADAHLALVEDRLGRPARRALILMCGRVGTGKSTVAEIVADALNGVVVSSDRVRKQLAGLQAQDRATTPTDEGIYTKERTRAVQHGLLDRAESILASGRIAVLDATHSRRESRDLAWQFAKERGHPALLIEVQCDDAVALERLTRRTLDPERISDAGPEFFAESKRRFEVPSDWPPEDHFVVRNDAEGWEETLRSDLDQWVGARLRARSA